MSANHRNRLRRPRGRIAHGERGTNFFISLAKKGNEVWNRWRQEHTNLPVTFEDVDFREEGNSQIDFSGFKFGNNANFRFSQFGDGPVREVRPFIIPYVPRSPARIDLGKPNETGLFAGAVFGDNCDFSGAFFGSGTDFSATRFGSNAKFVGASFGHHPTFAASSFAGESDFSDALFGQAADFAAVTFSKRVNFERARVGSHADFLGTVFVEGASFSSAVFMGAVRFAALSQEEWGFLAESATPGWRHPDREELKGCHRALRRTSMEPKWLDHMYFRGTIFDDYAEFNGRTFRTLSDFTGAVFSQPPSFDDCEGTHRIELYDTRFRFSGQFWRELVWLPTVYTRGWTAHSGVAERLRMVRKLAEDKKNHDLERDLYIEERKAERGILFMQYLRKAINPIHWPRLIAHCVWILIMEVYWLLADYGRSVMRPLALLALSISLFYTAYSKVLDDPTPENRDRFERALFAFTLSNAVPFVGALSLDRTVKSVLFCRGELRDATFDEITSGCSVVPKIRFQLLALGQSILSALLAFCAAVSLRNYFKVR